MNIEEDSFPHQNVKRQNVWKVTIVWYEGLQTFALIDEQKIEVWPYVIDYLDETDENTSRILCWIDEKRDPIIIDGIDFNISDY